MISFNIRKAKSGSVDLGVLELPFSNAIETLDSEFDNLVHIPSNLKYHGFDYVQVCRGSRAQVYRQMFEGKTEGFEISLIQIQEETILYGKTCKKHYRWPKDNDFGKTAWACWKLEEAMDKFNTLEK